MRSGALAMTKGRTATRRCQSPHARAAPCNVHKAITVWLLRSTRLHAHESAPGRRAGRPSTRGATQHSNDATLAPYLKHTPHFDYRPCTCRPVLLREGARGHGPLGRGTPHHHRDCSTRYCSMMEGLRLRCTAACGRQGRRTASQAHPVRHHREDTTSAAGLEAAKVASVVVPDRSWRQIFSRI